MPERRLLWPLLAYGALGAIALARQGVPRRDAPDAQRLRARDRPGLKARDRHPDRLEEQSRADRGEDDSEPAAVGSPAAHEHGRGRRATAPWSIPWRGWKDILLRTFDKFNDNRLMAVGAGVVFYVLLALFPAVAALVSLYGLVADPSKIDSSLSVVSGILPGGAMDLLHEELRRLTAAKGTGLSFGFLFGLLFALWSAMSGVKAIIDALNVANDEKEKRSFIRLNLVALAFTLGAMVSMALAITAVVVAPIVLVHLGLEGVGSTLVAVLRWPLLLALIIIGLAVLYRYGPSRREPRWRWLSVGSVTAAVLCLVG